MSEVAYVEKWLSRQSTTVVKDAVDVSKMITFELANGSLAWLPTTAHSKFAGYSPRVKELARRVNLTINKGIDDDLDTIKGRIACYLTSCKFIIHVQHRWYTSNTTTFPRGSQVFDDELAGPIIVAPILNYRSHDLRCGGQADILAIYFAKGSIYNEIASGTQHDNIASPMTCYDYHIITTLASNITNPSVPSTSPDQKSTDPNVAAGSNIVSGVSVASRCSKVEPVVEPICRPAVPQFILDQLHELRSTQAKVCWQTNDELQVWHVRSVDHFKSESSRAQAKIERDKLSKRAEVEFGQLVMIDDFIKRVTSL